MVLKVLKDVPMDASWSFAVDREGLIAGARERDRSAGLYFQAGSSEEDGLLYVRYREHNTDFGSQARLYFVAKAFQDAGLSIEIGDSEIMAVMEPEKRLYDRRELLAAASSALRALAVTPGIDAAFTAMARETPSQAEISAEIDDWARILRREGRLPFHEAANPQGTVASYRRYRLQEAQVDGGLPEALPGREASVRSVSADLLTPGLRVRLSAPITFDPSKAEGRIFVSPFFRASEITDLSKAKGIVLMAGSRRGVAAIMAARRGVPVLRLRRAEWTRHGLRVEAPGRDGFRTLLLREDDELLLDATAASLPGRPPEARLAVETVRESAAPVIKEILEPAVLPR